MYNPEFLKNLILTERGLDEVVVEAEGLSGRNCGLENRHREEAIGASVSAWKWRPLFLLVDPAMGRLELFVWRMKRLDPECLCRDHIGTLGLPQVAVFPAVSLPPFFPLPGGLTLEQHFLLHPDDSPDRGILFDPDSSNVEIAAQKLV